MSAKHALLGLLLDRPAHAYELANRLQTRLGPTWAINSGQLSQTIASLERAGLIERVEGAKERRLDTRVFAITERGVAEVDRWWLEEPASKTRLFRRPILLKLLLAGPERLDDALGQIKAYELECAERLKEVAHRRERVSMDGPRVHADHVMLRLALSGDIFQLEAELAWARQAQKVIAWLLNEEAIWPEARDAGGAQAAPSDDRRGARMELFGRMAARQPRAAGDSDGD